MEIRIGEEAYEYLIEELDRLGDVALGQFAFEQYITNSNPEFWQFLIMGFYKGGMSKGVENSWEYYDELHVMHAGLVILCAPIFKALDYTMPFISNSYVEKHLLEMWEIAETSGIERCTNWMSAQNPAWFEDFREVIEDEDLSDISRTFLLVVADILRKSLADLFNEDSLENELIN